MGRAAYVDSYYTDSAHPQAKRASLAGTVECDVCVVGGGLSGCSTALHLAQRGYSVVLLEAQRIGWGASGRSGAQALFGVAAGQAKLERLVGAADARRIWDLTVEGLSLQRELIERHAIDCDYVAGQMQVANKRRQDEELREEVETLHTRYAYPSIRLVARGELRGLIASERYTSATFDPNCGHLHPLNYTLGLAAAAEGAGAKIFEGSRAVTWNRTAGRLRLSTARGEVRCRHLALCGNASLGSTAPALARRIMAVGTSMVATEPLGTARAEALIANRAAVTDLNWVLDYFRLSADQRLLFGGRVNYAGFDALVAGRATRQRMLGVFPQLADVRISHAWAGQVDITLNRAPDFGRLEPDVYYLQGFSGHGITLTGIAGRLLGEAIAGTAERFDVFTRIPHRGFPGGLALRRPALVLAMAWYRLRDLL